MHDDQTVNDGRVSETDVYGLKFALLFIYVRSRKEREENGRDIINHGIIPSVLEIDNSYRLALWQVAVFSLSSRLESKGTVRDHTTNSC